jgi:hypothetical protein
MSSNAHDATATPLAGAANSVAGDKVRDDLVLGGATVSMGLLAGFFYSYACSVMPGLHGAADRTVVDAMQHINRSIENPVFFATFLGAPALVGWAIAIERRRGSRVVVRTLAVAGSFACLTRALFIRRRGAR